MPLNFDTLPLSNPEFGVKFLRTRGGGICDDTIFKARIAPTVSPVPVAQSVALALPKTDCWEDLDRIPLRSGGDRDEGSWDITLREISDRPSLETGLPKKPYQTSTYGFAREPPPPLKAKQLLAKLIVLSTIRTQTLKLHAMMQRTKTSDNMTRNLLQEDG